MAGRDPLDGVVASMLAQLLRKHGLGAQSALHGEVSRFAIKTLDTTGVALIGVRSSSTHVGWGNSQRCRIVELMGTNALALGFEPCVSGRVANAVVRHGWRWPRMPSN